VGAYCFLYKGEVERGEKSKGREEGGRGWVVREISTLLKA